MNSAADDIFSIKGNGMEAFQGTLDKNVDMSLVDPKQMVRCYLRPNRQYSAVIDAAAIVNAKAMGYRVENSGEQVLAHLIPGVPYNLTQMTFQAHRAVLCTPMEYEIIKRQMASPEAQNVTKQIQDMRAHQAVTSKRMQTEAQRRAEESARQEYLEDEQRTAKAQDLQRHTIEHLREVEDNQAAAARDQMLGQMTAEDLEVHCESLRAQGEAMSRNMGERARAAIAQTTTEEIAELRTRWGQLHPATGREAAKPAASLEQRAKNLNQLLAAGILTQEAYDRQLAALVSE
jgi:hypothetical protein